MEKNHPNKIVAECYKEFKRLHKDSEGMADKYDYKSQEVLMNKLKNIVSVIGAIEVMSKPNILKLIKMQCSLRFLPEWKFYAPFATTCDFLYP